MKTASIIAQRVALAIDVDAQLTERSFGHLEGSVVHEVKRNLGLALNEPIAAHLPTDAEQWPETKARTVAAIASWQARHPGERILFVAHHGLFAALSEVLLRERREGRNAVPYEFRRTGEAWSVVELAGGKHSTTA